MQVITLFKLAQALWALGGGPFEGSVGGSLLGDGVGHFPWAFGPLGLGVMGWAISLGFWPWGMGEVEVEVG